MTKLLVMVDWILKLGATQDGMDVNMLINKFAVVLAFKIEVNFHWYEVWRLNQDV